MKCTKLAIFLFRFLEERERKESLKFNNTEDWRVSEADIKPFTIQCLVISLRKEKKMSKSVIK